MSLNPQEMSNTRRELQENFELTGLTKAQVASDLAISEIKLERLFSLTQRSLKDPWILRNYLIKKVEETGQQPVPFTALKGDYHQYWFLNGRQIERGKMSRGDQ
ncbi:DUF2316 family protein [Levilactobacillus bambusae]|uniref:DUF2316 domain-containing protein n=1 Tax=Levilactobacillus bambusae TaxID=2024736 RepID=A0A2V1N0U8_9LACO|nr:DUF2316 family protein [Levilactobacillus bambusae]PWG00015.1 DUF2316 domain-containing protein [Levilactobacillus bambusae]